MNNMPNVFKSLQILLWNAAGIKNKFSEFINFLLEHNIDIALVTETHTNPQDKLTIANYNTYKTDRTRCKGGGTAIFIKRTLTSVQYSNLEKDGFEETSILYTNNGETIKITVIYNQPQNILTQTDIEHLFPKNLTCLVGGDYNAKNTIWGCRVNNKCGKILHELIKKNDLRVVAPTEPTFLPEAPQMQPDLLDYFITSNNIPVSCYAQMDLSSDHIPVIATVGINTKETNTTIKKTDWDLYYNLLNGQDPIPAPNSNEEIETSIKSLTDSLINAYNEATTTYERDDNYQKLPRDISELIRHKNYIRRMWQRNRNPIDKQNYNKLKREIREMCQKHKADTWNYKVENLCTSDNSIWKMAKCLRNKRDTNKPIIANDKNIYTDEEKLKIFADTIEKQFTLNANPCNFDEDIETEYIYNSYLSNNNNCTLGILNNVTQDDLVNIIKRLNNKKAPGGDGITNVMLKQLPRNKLFDLLNIYNACLKNCYYPTSWKNAIVVLFPKPGKDPRLPTNHRPISLLSTLGKVLEKLILLRLEPFLSFIPKEQYGFRKNLSTTKQLIRLIDFISDGIYKKESTALLMIDVAKAFDRVWHKALIKKLIQNNIPVDFIRILDMYLNNRTFQIRLNGKLSDKRPIRAGVPQGSLLGPILYIIYTSDFPINDKDLRSMVAFYADDTAIAVRSINPNKAINDLSEKMSDIEDWCCDNKIAINAEKSNLMIIRRRKTRIKINNNLLLFNKIVPIVTNADYLGLKLNHRLTWTNHVTKAINKTYAAVTALKPIMKKDTKLSIKLKRQLYMQCIRPILTYACPAWHNLKPTQLKRLETTQNKILRNMIGAPWFLPNKNIRKDLKIPTIEEYIKDLTTNFFKSAKNQTAAGFNTLLDKELIDDMRDYNPITDFFLSKALIT